MRAEGVVPCKNNLCRIDSSNVSPPCHKCVVAYFLSLLMDRQNMISFVYINGISP